MDYPYTEGVAHIVSRGILAREKTALRGAAFDEGASLVKTMTQTWSATDRVRMICMIVLENSDIVKYPVSPPSERAWDGG